MQDVRAGAALTRLRARESIFGVVQTIPVPTLTELAVWCGFDLIVLDCEHGIVDETAHVACLQAIGNSFAIAAVRVRPGDFGAVGRYLDFGADAILMPDVRSPADATAFVSAATFGPKGTRSSTGNARASRYGLGSQESVAAPILLALIEGAQAVSDIAAIAATPGLDGLVIGPSDLSADLGYPEQFTSAAYIAAFAKIEEAAARADLLLGSKPHPGFSAERLIARGHSIILASADIVALREGYRSALAAARGVSRHG